jgi:protein-L-isoaspartate(D-aspartate) O-methyltransferase
MSDLAAARLNMVESQVRTNDVTDVRLHDVMRALPREQFVPAARAYLAYADSEVEYAPGRWLLRPRDVSKMLQAVRPVPGERALAIAAPYAGAVLEKLGCQVTQRDADLTAIDGAYDLIMVEGSVATVPQVWLDALAPGGRLGVVERSGPVGKACIYQRSEDGFGRRDLFDSTPPVLAGFEVQATFAL